MKRITQAVVTVLSWLSLQVGGTQPAFAALRTMLDPIVEQDAGRLVVMVKSTFSGSAKTGAGIIFGYQKDALYIATANHNVRRGRETAHAVGVTFAPGVGPSLEIEAKVEPNYNSSVDVDLAVLRVRVGDVEGFQPGNVPFDRLGDPSVLARGDYVFPMGNPFGRAWSISPEPDRFAEQQGDELFFKSTSLAPGDSGGALWDKHLYLVGMIRGFDRLYGSALSVSRALAQVREWGYPVQLGNPPGGMVFEQVAAGWQHACGRTSEDVVYCFGSGASDALGIGTDAGSARLIRVTGGHRFKTIDVGRDFSCGLDINGQAFCWGSIRYLGRGYTRPASPGESRVPRLVTSSHRFRLLAAGIMGVCGLTEIGGVWCWGGHSEQLADPHRVAADVRLRTVQVAELAACGLADDGATHCWHLNDENFGVSQEMHGWPRFQSISLSSYYTSPGCGIDRRGTLYCWSDLDWGANAAQPQEPRDPSAIADAWIKQLLQGKDEPKRSLAETMIDAIMRGDAPKELATPQRLSTVTSGETHACGLTPDGVAWCWGENDLGQLGDGSKTTRNRPVRVKTDINFKDLSAGSRLTCGASKSGMMYCWGNVNGQAVTQPTLIPGQKVIDDLL